VDLIQCVARPGGLVLIFCPGVAEISALWQEMRWLEDGGEFQVLPLHSMIPREEQEAAFTEPDPQVRRVVISTDIAESSVTLPNVLAVIDTGLHRRVVHSDRRAISCLSTKWISRAAATQRSGRAGRTQPGLCLRLYTRRFFKTQMDAYSPAESLSMPLDRLYLQAKQLAEQLQSTVGKSAPQTGRQVLSQMIQPPSAAGIEAARQELAHLGAIVKADEVAEITAFGRLCLQLPIDLRLARMVWLGALWGLTADAVVLAAVLSSLEPFLAPSPHFMRDEEDYVQTLRDSTRSRILFDGGGQSEPLMLRQVFLEWLVRFHEHKEVEGRAMGRKRAWGAKDILLQKRRRHTEAFSKIFLLAKGRMEHMVSQVLDLALRTFRVCEPGSRVGHQLQSVIASLGYAVDPKGDLSALPAKQLVFEDVRNVFEDNIPLLKALLAASFSDNLLIGSYWSQLQASSPGELGKETKRQFKNEAQLHAIAVKGMPLEHTVLFNSKDGQPVPGIEAYVDFVCGCQRAKPQEVLEGHGAVLVELDQTSGRGPLGGQQLHLRSRREGLDGSELDDSGKGLPLEFGLLHHFGLAMREVQRSTGFQRSHGAHILQHPCMLQWEFMQPPCAAKGGSGGKGWGGGKPAVARCSALLERKNALGFATRLPADGTNQSLSRVAVFAVSASVQGSEAPGRVYPVGTTVLPASHLGFILLTAKLNPTQGMRRFGMTARGVFSILCRCVNLPGGCLGKAWWEQVRKLRAILRLHLSKTPSTEQHMVASRACAGCPPLLLGDVGDIQDSVWSLLTTGLEFESKEATELAIDPRWAADIFVSPALSVPTALQPLAAWDELERRRAQLWQPEETHTMQEDEVLEEDYEDM